MKVIRTIILTGGMCLAATLATAAGAQQGGSSTPPSPNAAPASPAPPATGRSSKGASKLDPDAPENDDALHLTDEQRDKIKSIREDAKQRALDVQKDKSLSDDVKERKLKQIRKETRAQVFAVMTPDQQQQWIAEQRARRAAKRAGSTSE
jgi:Spy/CpxP family protein refolding chaperone